jgi:Protein of unknown function (DUF3237)
MVTMRLVPEMTYRETIAGPWGPTTGNPLGDRLCWEVPAATITGPRIDLTLAMPGADWIRLGTDGVRRPDQRLVFTTRGGAVVLLRYDVAVIRESPAFLAALRSGQETGFDDQYIRMSPQFETGAAELGWLTSSLWIGEGRLAGPHQIEYRIHRVD